MAEMERIINKLRNYCIDELHMKKSGQGVTFWLKAEKDFHISDDNLMDIVAGRAFGGSLERLKDVLTDNYITSVLVEKYDLFLSLTERECNWLESYDEDGMLGADLIEEWIWDNVDVAVNEDALKRYVKEVVANHSYQAA